MAKILVISPTPSHPQNAGNRARIFNLFSNLQRNGHEIHFFHITMEDGNAEQMKSCWDGFYQADYHSKSRKSLFFKIIHKAKRTFLTDKIKPLGIDDWYDESVDPLIVDLSNKIHFDAVIVEYAFFSKALDCIAPKILKVVDAHDIIGNRHELFTQRNQLPDFFYTTRDEERKGLTRADVIIAIQNKENSYFSKLTSKKVITVGHTTGVPQPTAAKKEKSTKKLLYVGSSNKINVYTFNYLIDEIFPRLKRIVPDVEIDVVGNICKKISRLPPGCNIVGEVSDLSFYYRNCDVAVNPIQFGTGLKIKNIEALSHGIPLVTTSIGAEGIEDGAGSAFLVADSEESFIKSVVDILSNPSLFHSLSKGACDYAEKYNEKNLESLLALLHDIKQQTK